MRSREAVDNTRGAKAVSSRRESGTGPPSPAPGAWYFRFCHFLALGRKKGKGALLNPPSGYPGASVKLRVGRGVVCRK